MKVDKDERLGGSWAKGVGTAAGGGVYVLLVRRKEGRQKEEESGGDYGVADGCMDGWACRSSSIGEL